MAGVIIAALIVAAATLITIVLFYDRKQERAPQTDNNDHGEWTITERNVGFGATGIFVVRRRNNRTEPNASILVGKIPDGAPDWTDRYEELMAQARDRLASLRGNK